MGNRLTRWMRRALQIEPGATWINRTLAVAYARIGDHSAARQGAEALRRYRPAVWVRDWYRVLPTA